MDYSIRADSRAGWYNRSEKTSLPMYLIEPRVQRIIILQVSIVVISPIATEKIHRHDGNDERAIFNGLKKNEG